MHWIRKNLHNKIDTTWFHIMITPLICYCFTEHHLLSPYSRLGYSGDITPFFCSFVFVVFRGCPPAVTDRSVVRLLLWRLDRPPTRSRRHPDCVHGNVFIIFKIFITIFYKAIHCFIPDQHVHIRSFDVRTTSSDNSWHASHEFFYTKKALKSRNAMSYPCPLNSQPWLPTTTTQATATFF